MGATPSKPLARDRGGGLWEVRQFQNFRGGRPVRGRTDHLEAILTILIDYLRDSATPQPA